MQDELMTLFFSIEISKLTLNICFNMIGLNITYCWTSQESCPKNAPRRHIPNPYRTCEDVAVTVVRGAANYIGAFVFATPDGLVPRWEYIVTVPTSTSTNYYISRRINSCVLMALTVISAGLRK